MNDTLSSTRSSPALLCVAAIGAILLGLAAMSSLPASLLSLTDGAAGADAPAGQVFEARRAKEQTKGQLPPLALHLSKMRGGASVGGFPGFEPPDDDEEYRRKIKDEAYSARDVNDWVKEINNFLGRIVKKNPNLSFEEILQRQGLTAEKIKDFVEALQRAHVTADGMKGYGVSVETVERLESLMRTLRIPTWTY